MFFYAVKLVILTWGVYGTDSLLEPASSGQSMHCSFSHFGVGFARESRMLPLGNYTFLMKLQVSTFKINIFTGFAKLSQ